MNYRGRVGGLGARCSCIFKRVALITPNMANVIDYTRNPVAVFNPGAHLEGGEALIFPRLIFDYLNYTSSIGAFKVNADDKNGCKLCPFQGRDMLSTSVTTTSYGYRNTEGKC